MKHKISIIVAMDDKRGIGKNNDLLFRIPEDFNRMRTLTSGHPIIMGRKTFDSIGRVLPKRTNIIVTRDTSYHVNGAIVVHSLTEGIEKAKVSIGGDEIFVFGGGELWKEAIQNGNVDTIYATLVKGDFGADTFFPEYSEFTKVMKKEEGQFGEYSYTFVDLEK